MRSPSAPASVAAPRARSTLERITRRDAALRATRAFFHGRGFVEADTHQLVPAPGTEPHIDPLGIDVDVAGIGAAPTRGRRYLITSPELALKRVVAAGVPRVFQLVHVFRDGERGPRHHPEFTMLEWYRAGGTLDDIVDDTVSVVRAVASAIGNASAVDVDNAPVVVRVKDAFAAAGVDLDAALDAHAAADARALWRAVAAVDPNVSAGANVSAVDDATAFDLAFFHMMAAHVEPALPPGRLSVVTQWPAPMAVLARLDDDRRYACRFEMYAPITLAGRPTTLELCNAFDELCDPVEQRARFVADNALRVRLGKAPVPLDDDFLAALASLPSPTAGNALGFDRLLLMLGGDDDLDDVSALPWR